MLSGVFACLLRVIAVQKYLQCLDQAQKLGCKCALELLPVSVCPGDRDQLLIESAGNPVAKQAGKLESAPRQVIRTVDDPSPSVGLVVERECEWRGLHSLQYRVRYRAKLGKALIGK